MQEFQTKPGQQKPELYADLCAAARAMIEGERDTVANMANVAALIWQCVPGLNWAGFYRVIDDALVLGPFIGKPACIRIPFGQGVCGTAAASGQIQLVPDVHAFPGHIACDSASRSELVVPVLRTSSCGASAVIAVMDLDSPQRARFDDEDARGIAALAQLIAPFV